ncbi:Rtr1/RPAP2 family-domain-containing protein [Mycotypha africana]|uniref:Rtr1/RPAP2 family-domain-containing protein n=1 Tax=Mycotypha africana TaxID=64632 RepID=UPI0023004603|nr:Rtr1/RPAP2 family-domain-containing protein [Mycotypha africana]KAI8969963.1 Rtr1/RPAP2 family-domain-containing protein [Mycotypha africana]
MATSTPGATSQKDAQQLSPAKRVPRRRKKKPLTPRQKLVQDSAQQRFKIEKLVFVWQEKLFSQPKVTMDTLQRAATYLQPKTYEEVVEERVVQEWCGYPICDDTARTGVLNKFKISLSERKIVDQTEQANYCSEECYRKSKYYILQLSTEPVWFRDLNVPSDVHIIKKEEDFRSAIDRQRKRLKAKKSKEEIRKDYLQKLLGRLPNDTDNQFQIVEKSGIPIAVDTQQAGLHDCIEGYRIELKNDSNKPTTIILKKEKKSEKTEASKDEAYKVDGEKKMQEIDSVDPEDPEALFETMMMLKSMDLDKEDQTAEKMGQQPVKKRPAAEEKMPKENSIISKPLQCLDTGHGEPQQNLKSQSPANKVPTKDTKKKQHRNVPELSLFGTIWTLLDRLTTKATRVYLNELESTKQRLDIPALLKEHDLIDEEAALLRAQVFSEQIIESYQMIQIQLGIKENLQDDILNVIRTFRFSDATMASLNAAQCYMMTLVIMKPIADSLLDDDRWIEGFKDCCKVVDQSVDMVDACVRVLKVAST